jgi:hypothetical protein
MAIESTDAIVGQLDAHNKAEFLAVLYQETALAQ